LIVAIGTAGETACPTLLEGGAGGFACRWKLISIAIQIPKTVMRLLTPVLLTLPKVNGYLSN